MTKKIKKRTFPRTINTNGRRYQVAYVTEDGAVVADENRSKPGWSFYNRVHLSISRLTKRQQKVWRSFVPVP